MATYAILSLPEIIFAEPEILGRVDSISVNGLTGTISTPNDDHLQPAREYWEMVEWEWADPEALEPPTGVPLLLPGGHHIDWGWISGRSEYGVGINALLLSFDTEKEHASENVRSWLWTLADWLQAYTAQVLTSQSAQNGLPSLSVQTWRVEDGEAKPVRDGYPEEGRYSPPWALATSVLWEAAVRFASAGEELPLSWQLLGDGLRALHTGQLRRAVVEASTSVEVTVRQAIRTRAEQCGDQAVAEVITGQRNTLGSLFKLARNLGITLPGALNDLFVALRNRVVHRGDLPSPTEALAIWQAARAFFQERSPLPSTCRT